MEGLFSDEIVTEDTHKYILTIEGLQYPLCNSVVYAQFRNLKISAANCNTAANAYLAKSAKRSTINGVAVLESAKQLAYFASRNVCCEYGNNSIS